MKKLTFPALFALFALLFAAVSTAAQYTNFMAASNVIGQPNFTTGTSGTTLNKMNQPRGIAVDPASGKVFVSEQGGNRILRFASTAGLINGATAEAVFAGTGVSATSLNNPLGMDVDAGGRLWVADFLNNRVLRFDNAATMASNSPASAVLGQATFTTNAAATTQNGMTFPFDVHVDSAGRLWVADSGNHRVLRFDNAAALANGANADAVLGQPNFTSNTFATTAAAMWSVNSIHVDAGGRLWASDGNNCRVLRFDNAASKPNGANADGVLGQANFTTRACATSQTAVRTTVGLHVDQLGRLYVGDFNANRVLIFLNAATLANGAPASIVLGQPGFTSSTSNTGGLNASSLSQPNFPFYDENSSSLYVSDRDNHRVLRYASSPPTTAGVSVSGRVITSAGVGINGATVKATGGDGVARTVKTNSFGYYSFASLPAGDTYVFEVTAKSFSFAPQVVSVNDAIENLNFTAIE